MSAGAKPVVELALASIRRSGRSAVAHSAARTRQARRGTHRQFAPDPDGPFDPLPAQMPVTPAVRMFIREQVPFEIDGDLYLVDEVFRSHEGRQADLLILRGHEYMSCPERSSRRAMQVRDLEILIERERVDIPFGPSARHFNLSRGWCLGGPTLASLGIDIAPPAQSLIGAQA